MNPISRGTVRRAGLSAVLLAALLAASGARADVKLNPGSIEGTAGLSGWELRSGYANFYGNANGFSGSASFSGNTFSVTLEGGQTYDGFSLTEYFDNGYVNLYGWSEGIAVPSGGTAHVGLSMPGGTIVPRLTVVGGTLNSAQLRASASFGNRSITSYSWSYDAANGTRIPMAASPSVGVEGNVSVGLVDADGRACTVEKYFPWTQVALTEGATVEVPATIDVTADTCSIGVAGTVDYRNAVDGVTVNGGYVSVSGATSRSEWFNTVPHSYRIDGLQPGSAYVYADLYTANGGWLRLPGSTWLTIDNSLNTHDFSFDASAVSVPVNLTGTAAGRLNGSLYAYAYGSSEASSGGSANASAWIPTGETSATVKVPATPGQWVVNQISASFSDWTPGNERSEWLSHSSYGASPVAAAAGQLAQSPATELALSEGSIVFDVVEPPGSEVIGISNPAVYAYFYDPAANSYEYVNAYGYVNNAPTATVRIAGRPGVYHFDAWATVKGSWTRFASSTIELGQSANTPTGANVTIQPTDSSGAATPVSLTFGDVVGGGETSVSTTDVGPAAPQDYDLVEIVKDAKYITVNTSATFTDKVQVAIHYDGEALGLTEAEQSNLKLQQYVCTTSSDCSWQVINQSADATDPHYFGNSSYANGVDTANDVIYGVTSSLSTFGLTMPNVVLVPPTSTCVGTSAAAAFLTTDAGQCTAAVDNTNQRAGGCSGGGGGLLACTFDGATSSALPVGVHEVAVSGTAVDGSTAGCTSYVEVADREAPALSCAAPVTVECGGETTSVKVSATCADNCGTCAATCGTGAYGLGTHAVSCNGADQYGNKGGCTTSVKIVDTTAPGLTVAASPSVLWPPNHKLVAVALTKSVKDLCDSAPSVTCTAVSSDPDNGQGDGDTADDVQWKNGQLFLRAERSAGKARTYTVTCTATDASGNKTSASAAIKVPMTN